MDTVGQFGPISVLPNEEVKGIFTVTKVTKLEKPNQPCELDPKYSYTDCLQSYVKRTTKCSVDLLTDNFNCTSDGFIKLFNTLNRIKVSAKQDIIKNTGCLPKCTTFNYYFHSSSVEKVTWKKDWIASFYLSTRSTSYPRSVENYSYDEQVDVYYIYINISLH